MYLLLIGPSASGKGTQAEKLISRFGLAYLEMGGLLRRISEQQTPLGKEVNEIINQGLLVPDRIIVEVVENYLGGLDRMEGVLFDGFPRILSQAKILEKFLEKKGKKIDLAIYLKVPREVIFERISNRRICKECGSAYNLVTNPPKKESLCDKCKGKLTVRKDETPEKINARLDWFENQTKPVIEYFRGKGILEEIDGDQSIDEIFEEIVDRLEKRGLTGK